MTQNKCWYRYKTWSIWHSGNRNPLALRSRKLFWQVKMENWLGFCRNSSQNPRIEGRTRSRDVMETTQLLTSLISKCAMGSFCFLHRTVVFWNISTHSSCVAATVPSLLGLSVQGSRKTTYFFFVFSSPTFCSGRHNLIGLVQGRSQVCSLCQGWEEQDHTVQIPPQELHLASFSLLKVQIPTPWGNWCHQDICMLPNHKHCRQDLRSSEVQCGTMKGFLSPPETLPSL